MILHILKPLLLWLMIFTLTGETAMAESAETKTYCVGRYLIDIPVDFKIGSRGGSFQSVRIERLGPGNQQDINEITDSYMRALRNGEIMDDATPQKYRSSEHAGKATIITRWGDYSQLGVDFSNMWMEDAYFSSQGEMFRATTGMGTESKFDFHAYLIKVANATYPYNQAEIPKGQGTCIKDSFIALPRADEDAHATFIKDVDGYRIAFSIGVSIREPGGYQILSEVANSNLGDPAEIAGFKGRKERDYGDYMDFQAIVGQKTTKNDFGYEIHIEYYNHHPNNGYFSTIRKDADHDWENVLNSIRLRR